MCLSLALPREPVVSTGHKRNISIYVNILNQGWKINIFYLYPHPEGGNLRYLTMWSDKYGPPALERDTQEVLLHQTHLKEQIFKFWNKNTIFLVKTYRPCYIGQLRFWSELLWEEDCGHHMEKVWETRLRRWSSGRGTAQTQVWFVFKHIIFIILAMKQVL